MNSQDILKTLVAFDTTSHLSNLDFIDWVETYLAGFGVTGHRVVSPEGNKANYYATIGPANAGGVILSGHTDVVPVDGQTWSTDPFTLTQNGGKLYGRGTCDMKGFIACALACVPDMTSLKRPIHLALSYDEEVGCRGVAPMVREIISALPPIEAVIVGEPTMMQLITGHKGIAALKTKVVGVPAHSSQTQLGQSAVMLSAQLISELMEIAKTFQSANQLSADFDPPHTTVTINQIEGGTAINILAEHCTFMWDIRSLPGDHAQQIVKVFRGHCDAVVRSSPHNIKIDTEVFADAPGLSVKERNAAEALVRRLSGANQSSLVSFATEAGFFQQAGYDTVVFGPGDIAQAHQPDEFITEEQLSACDAFLKRLITHLS